MAQKMPDLALIHNEIKVFIMELLEQVPSLKIVPCRRIVITRELLPILNDMRVKLSTVDYLHLANSSLGGDSVDWSIPISQQSQG